MPPSDEFVHRVRFTADGDYFHPLCTPMRRHDKIIGQERTGPYRDWIGNYGRGENPERVFRLRLDEERDAIVCPGMAARVLIPHAIETWGQLVDLLEARFGGPSAPA